MVTEYSIVCCNTAKVIIQFRLIIIKDFVAEV